MDRGIGMKFVLVIIMIGMSVVPDDACIEREREALLTFKKELIDEYGVLTSWRSVDQECCKWFGVVCSNTTAHVISLNLENAPYTTLRGTIASSLLELHHLTYLNLNWNNFGGIPIPQFIGSMKQLQHLHLRYSGFSGNIPPQIGNLTNLRSLDLAVSGYSFSIKNLEWLSSLSLLSYLDLSGSDLSHTDSLQPIVNLPSLRELSLGLCTIGDNVKPFANSSFTSLSILDLTSNGLSRSSSFDWLSNTTTSLVSLDLSFNALNGSILNALLERLIYIENLSISGTMVEGEILKSLGDLSHLRVLDSYQNNHRHFDELFGNLSNKGILQSLQILNLEGNKLNGTVPDLRAFSSLTEVHFGGNNFTNLPLSIGQLPKLQVLEIFANSLEGTVTESHFIQLHSLKTLDLSRNPLIFDTAPDWIPPFQLDRIFLAYCNVGPSFPKWIQTQRNFSALDLSIGGITDEAPRWLWTTSPFLHSLHLSDNQISGIIPNLSSTSILNLDLSNNKFSGPIPLFTDNAQSIHLSGNMFSGSISSICENLLSRLIELDLSNNQLLGGEVPNCGEKMPNLYYLNLANNSFSGEIPESFGSFNHLGALQLRDNNLSGELPSSMRLLQDIVMIDVGGNELTGVIPSWIGDMYNIRFLNLGTNRFHGSVPPGICNLTLIHILDLSINNLSGKIPDCFNNFTALGDNELDSSYPNFLIRDTYIYSSFQWKGREREYKYNLGTLKLIDFSSNKLTGNIPRSFSSMIGLNSLNLSRNALSGNITPDIGQMENLDSLDLSDNRFSGQIPSSLAKIYNIGFLNLSNNHLSGKIPMSTQLQSFDASSYGGNDGLCGPPLALCQNDSLPSPPATITRENMNEEEGIFSFMQEVGISMGFGFIFGFWGVVGSLFLKKSWRNAYFTFFDAVGDWLYVRTALFASKWRPS